MAHTSIAGVRLRGVLVIGVLALLGGLVLPVASPAYAIPEEPGFQDTVVFSGLNQPTAVEFSPDGRIFVAEKRGVVKVFDGLTDPTPDVFADLNVNVYNFWDRGLLGLALDPDFPTTPYVYVLYTHDAEIGGTAPRWGTPGVYSDPCPTPPGPTADGCVVSGRLSRLQASGNAMVGDEVVLIEDWCQQYPSHSIGSLAFGADGALYVSGGDGASFGFVDYGQDGDPLNPCGDPPGGVGGTQTPPSAEGGALRSQDLRTGGDPVTLDGTIVRVDPATGLALPDNPLIADPDPNAQQIIAYGLRNPFRITVRPGTSEVWVGDVGYNAWEEVNRIPDPTDPVVENFGWPCYEGPNPQFAYNAADLTICEDLYATPGAVTDPYLRYRHVDQVVPGEGCPTGGSSIAGIVFAFYGGGAYPAEYDGALFFADYSRKCIWVSFPGADGLPNPSNIKTFISAAANPVDLKISPAGELFYVDFAGTIHRVEYVGTNQAPTAVASADPTAGPAPLIVSFDGTGSTDPDPGDTLTYAWDLDGDGQFDDSTEAQPTYTYGQAGTHTATLLVTDSQGLSDTDAVVIEVAGNTPPTATITTPAPGSTWQVGDVVAFAGSATDPQEGALPASSLTWSLILHHCPDNCHAHHVQDFVGVADGSFVAPDHEYPAYLELQLTATDAGGLQDTTSVQLDPQTVLLTFKSKPGGMLLAVGSTQQATTFERTVIVGSKNSVSAVSPQPRGKHTYYFSSWSDGGAQSHDIIAPATPTTYLATYTTSNTDTPPSVSITSPAEGATVAGSITVTADASDDKGVSQVEFFVDGVSLGVDNDGSNGWSVPWDTTGVPDGAHAVGATATDSIGQTASDSNGVTVDNVPDPPLPAMHLGDLDGSSAAGGKGGKWQATVTVTVHDADEGAVAGAVVTGSWSAGASGSASCTTDGAGRCTVTKGNINRNSGSVTFTVDGVAHSSYAYEAGGNHDPDGDSTGSSISVSKP